MCGINGVGGGGGRGAEGADKHSFFSRTKKNVDGVRIWQLSVQATNTGVTPI